MRYHQCLGAGIQAFTRVWASVLPPNDQASAAALQGERSKDRGGMLSESDLQTRLGKAVGLEASGGLWREKLILISLGVCVPSTFRVWSDHLQHRLFLAARGLDMQAALDVQVAC
jgi:hypothetical protein